MCDRNPESPQPCIASDVGFRTQVRRGRRFHVSLTLQCVVVSRSNWSLSGMGFPTNTPLKRLEKQALPLLMKNTSVGHNVPNQSVLNPLSPKPQSTHHIWPGLLLDAAFCPGHRAAQAFRSQCAEHNCHCHQYVLFLFLSRSLSRCANIRGRSYVAPLGRPVSGHLYEQLKSGRS